MGLVGIGEPSRRKWPKGWDGEKNVQKKLNREITWELVGKRARGKLRAEHGGFQCRLESI